MEILVIYSNNDQAGVSIVKKLIENNDFEKEESNKNEIYKKNNLRIISTDKDLVNINDLSPFNADLYVFASRHKAEKGKPTLSAHFTGNFSSEARLGGNGKEIAISFPGLLKDYMKNLWNLKNEIKEFNIVIEATHHGPTSLRKPSIFIEIGPSMKEWVNENAAELVSKSIWKSCSRISKSNKVAIGFGGPHYSEKFTKFIIESEFSLASVASKYNLQYIDKEMVIQMKNKSIEPVRYAALDWKGLGKEKKRLIDVINELDLEVIRI